MDDARLVGGLRRVVERFFAGVLLEDDGSTSNDFARLLLRTFAFGVPGLPRLGMQALPRQLAAALATPVRTGTAVDSIRREGGSMLVRAAGAELRAEQVVVATDPAGAESLALGIDGGGATGSGVPAMKGVLTHWVAASEPPTRLNLLCVDARERPGGPLVNTAVVSNAAPGYAPAGRHLVQTSALFGPGRPVPGDDAVRRHAAEIYGADAVGWDLVARHEVPNALPVQPSPLGSPQPGRDLPRTLRLRRPPRHGLHPGCPGKRPPRGAGCPAPGLRVARMRYSVSRHIASRHIACRYIAAPAAEVWELLTDVGRWPEWGPSVRGAELASPGFTAGSTGRVKTVAGVSLPFTVTEFRADRFWSWSVAGVSACPSR